MNRTCVLRLLVDARPSPTIDQDGAPAWRGRSVPHHTAASGGGRYYLTAVFFATFALIAGGLFGLWFFALLIAYAMIP